MGKRLFDLLAAVCGLVSISPLLLVIAAAIKVDSPGAIFFRQERIGRSGVPFRIHKFRTMRMDAEGKGQLTVGRDGRVTRVGRVLRRFKLDELPQLIDILTGDMSLVGPRPEVPKYVAVYPPDVKARVLSIRPGITDFASIAFRNENALLGSSQDPERTYVEEVLPEKLKLNLAYLDRQSFLLDLQIIFKTLLALIR